MIFEVHITGEKSINNEFDAMGIKNIVVELLKPNLSHFRTEYMCSHIMECENYEQCYFEVKRLVSFLESKVIRVKIECPAKYREYFEQSIYIECHWKEKYSHINLINPISRNKKSDKLLATQREYKKSLYEQFITNYTRIEGVEIELCLYDDYIREDFDWFKLYKIN